jgi:hypothetical protein
VERTPPLNATACVDADGRLVIELTCVKCGYDLRSQVALGACPECGAPVAESLRPERLCFAPLDWLRGLIRGLRMIFVASLGVPLLLVFGMFLSGECAGGCVMVIVLGLILLSLTVGVFFFSQSDGRVVSNSARHVARISAIVLLACVGLGLLSVDVHESEAVWIVCWFGVQLSLGVLATTLGLHMGHLARRIPAPKLERFARLVGIAQGTVAGLACVLFAWVMLASVMDAGPGDFLVVGVTWLWLSFLALSLVATGLMIAMHVRLTRTLRTAEKLWNAGWASPLPASSRPGKGEPG